MYIHLKCFKYFFKSAERLITDLLQKERLKSQALYAEIVGLSQQLKETQSHLDEQMKKAWDTERMINNLTASYKKIIQSA